MVHPHIADGALLCVGGGMYVVFISWLCGHVSTILFYLGGWLSLFIEPVPCVWECEVCVWLFVEAVL